MYLNIKSTILNLLGIMLLEIFTSKFHEKYICINIKCTVLNLLCSGLLELFLVLKSRKININIKCTVLNFSNF